MPIGTPTGYLDITNATLRGSQIVTTGYVGIANANPVNHLSVGSNLHINDTHSNVLQISGNINAAGVVLGGISIAPTFDLEIVTNTGNTTPYTVEFNNTATAFVTTANVGIGTNAPAYELDVVGNVNFTGGLYQDGVAFVGGGGSSLWSQNGNDAYYNTGNIGIGTDTPESSLHINDTDAIIVPNGTTTQRPANPLAGSLRYNNETGYFETYTALGWGVFGTPPTISSISPTSFDGSSGTEFTITGTFFDTTSTVEFVGSDGTSSEASTVTYVSSTTLRATTSTDLPVSGEPYRVKISNRTGITTMSSAIIDAGSVPSFTTNSGLLISSNWSESFTTAVQASDAENSISDYSIIRGILPNGATLNSTTGDITYSPTEQSTTRYTFAVEATDDTGNKNSRDFSIQILNAPPIWISPENGNTYTIKNNTSVNITLSAIDPEGSSISYSEVNNSLPSGLSISGSSIIGNTTENSGTSNTSIIRASDGYGFVDRIFYFITDNSLYTFTSFTFTNAGATGKDGPTLSDLQNTYTDPWTGDTNYLNMTTQGFQLWTVPQTGTYEFSVVGANGGDAITTYRGGYSRILTGRINLNVNDVIIICVGQKGTNASANNSNAGSGGGGTFVVKNTTPLTPLIVSGGGGGGAYTAEPVNYSHQNGYDVRTDNYSTTGTGTTHKNNGDGGDYGTTGNSHFGGGGGGFNSNGAGDPITTYVQGGRGFSNGLVGGLNLSTADYGNGNGGFGGGGASWADNYAARAGGGGGYSGAMGGRYSTGYSGGAGGNYFDTSLVSNRTYGSLSTTDHGYVTVTLV
jgi:hypothetical protein